MDHDRLINTDLLNTVPPPSVSRCRFVRKPSDQKKFRIFCLFLSKRKGRRTVSMCLNLVRHRLKINKVPQEDRKHYKDCVLFSSTTRCRSGETDLLHETPGILTNFVKSLRSNFMLFDVYKFHVLNYPKLYTYVDTLVVMLILLFIKVVLKRVRVNLRQRETGGIGIR